MPDFSKYVPTEYQDFFGASSSNNSNNMVEWLLPLIGAGLSAGTGIFGSLQNKSAVNKANALNEELFHEQLAWNEKIWHMNNVYNSPAQQMSRLEAAGLNPNLAYGELGSGQSSPPSTPSPAPMQPALSDYSGVSSAFQTLGEIPLRQKQLEGLTLDNERKRIENDIRSQDLSDYQDYLRRRNRQLDDLHDQSVKSLQETSARIDNIIADTGLKNAEKVKTSQEAQNLLQDYLFKEQLNPELLNGVRLDNKQKEKALKLMDNQIKLLALQCIGQSTQNEILRKECDHWEEKFTAEINKMQSETDLNIVNAIKVGYDGQRIALEVDKEKLRQGTLKGIKENGLDWDNVGNLIDQLTVQLGYWVENIGSALRFLR